jgi:hypothetical protein
MSSMFFDKSPKNAAILTTDGTDFTDVKPLLLIRVIRAIRGPSLAKARNQTCAGCRADFWKKESTAGDD